MHGEREALRRRMENANYLRKQGQEKSEQKKSARNLSVDEQRLNSKALRDMIADKRKAKLDDLLKKSAASQSVIRS